MRAQRQDANQAQLVQALKKIGAKCYFIGKPVDLLVTFRGRTLLLEIKNPEGRNRMTKEQEDFIVGWGGEIHICRSVDEAINAVVDPSRN